MTRSGNVKVQSIITHGRYCSVLSMEDSPVEARYFRKSKAQKTWARNSEINNVSVNNWLKHYFLCFKPHTPLSCNAWSQKKRNKERSLPCPHAQMTTLFWELSKNILKKDTYPGKKHFAKYLLWTQKSLQREKYLSEGLTWKDHLMKPIFCLKGNPRRTDVCHNDPNLVLTRLDVSEPKW
jgi:hypothetical protein